tara:strand:+ start:2675 stop:3481 length:807 start_codon:yes stop_codon:yes gene_type:complete
MDFNEKLKLTGHLEVIKIDNKTGEETVLFDDHNVITSGLGQSIAQFMTASGCYNLTPSTSSCLPDFQRYGPRPSIVPEGTENQLRESADWSESFAAAAAADGTRENCCAHILSITGALTFKAASRTSQTYTGTIQVGAITKCLHVWCEGKRDVNPDGWVHGPHMMTCDEVIEQSGGNSWNSTMNSTWTVGGIMRFNDYIWKKAGCCKGPCPDVRNVKTYTVTGTVPSGDMSDPAQAGLTIVLVQNALIGDYSFGGNVAKPVFKACCGG